MSGGSNSAGQIKSYVDRILRVKDEVADLNRDVREIYAEAKSNGFDKTVLGKLVNYVAKRRDNPDAVAEGEAIFEIYLSAYYGTEIATHAHEATTEAADDTPPDPLRSAAAAGNEAGAAASAPNPVEGLPAGEEQAQADASPAPARQWKYTDKPHPDCLDPSTCGGFSNLGLCGRCKDAAAMAQTA